MHCFSHILSYLILSYLILWNVRIWDFMCTGHHIIAIAICIWDLLPRTLPATYIYNKSRMKQLEWFSEIKNHCSAASYHGNMILVYLSIVSTVFIIYINYAVHLQVVLHVYTTLYMLSTCMHYVLTTAAVKQCRLWNILLMREDSSIMMYMAEDVCPLQLVPMSLLSCWCYF